MKLEVGQTVQFQSVHQKFEYIDELGSGGTGRTVLLQDRLTKVKYAFKKFEPVEKEYKEEYYRRFIDEIIALHKITHPNIVRIYTYYLYDIFKSGYIQMEYIDGTSIDTAISGADIGLYEEGFFDKVFLQAIDAFKYLESMKILHRDIRFQNVMIDSNDNLKLIDFGFSKVLDNMENVADSIVLNWPATMHPEEITNDKPYYDIATEIYYLGILFRRLKEMNPNVSFSYDHIVKKMIEPIRNNRYTSFNKIVSNLASTQMSKDFFTDNERSIYSDFAEPLSNMIYFFHSKPTFIESLTVIEKALIDAKRNNILESFIQNNTVIVECFIGEGIGYNYQKKHILETKTFKRFVDFFVSSSKEKKVIIIENLKNRLSSITIKYPIEDDLPF